MTEITSRQWKREKGKIRKVSKTTTKQRKKERAEKNRRKGKQQERQEKRKNTVREKKWKIINRKGIKYYKKW